MPKHVTIDTLVEEITAQVEAGLLGTAVLPGNTVYNPPPPTPRRIDNFTRTIANGLGSPELTQFPAYLGSAYSADLQVDNGFATSSYDPTGGFNGVPGYYGAALPYDDTDQDITLNLQITSHPNFFGGTAWVGLRLTYSSNGQALVPDGYAVQINNDGSMQIGKFQGGGFQTGNPVGDFTAVGSIPEDGEYHTLRLQLIGQTLKAAIDSDADADLKTVSTNVGIGFNGTQFSSQQGPLGVWMNFVLSNEVKLDYLEFNYPGVFYSAVQPGANTPPVDLSGVVSQSGQAFHGPTGYVDVTVAGLIVPVNTQASDCVVVTAASALKDGCGVQLAYAPGVDLVLKSQKTVTTPCYTQGGYANSKGSALAIKSDGIYYMMWGAQEYSSGVVEISEVLQAWPDSSYNFTANDEIFVIFDGDTMEVRKNNVVSVTGFDYVTALSNLVYPIFQNPPMQPAEVAAIRASTDFGFSGNSSSGGTNSPFVILP